MVRSWFSFAREVKMMFMCLLFFFSLYYARSQTGFGWSHSSTILLSLCETLRLSHSLLPLSLVNPCPNLSSSQEPASSLSKRSNEMDQQASLSSSINTFTKPPRRIPAVRRICKKCEGPLVSIGRARANGKRFQADWANRQYHKKCWKQQFQRGR